MDFTSSIWPTSYHRNVCSLFFTFLTLLISSILVSVDRLEKALQYRLRFANRFNVIRTNTMHTPNAMHNGCPKCMLAHSSHLRSKTSLNIIFSNYTFCWPWMCSLSRSYNTNLIILQVTAASNARRCKSMLFSFTLIFWRYGKHNAHTYLYVYICRWRRLHQICIRNLFIPSLK